MRIGLGLFYFTQMNTHNPAQNNARQDKFVDILQQICSQQVDIGMRSHGLRQLVDDKSDASCQQTCCKLIVETCYPQACCKLFQQVVTSLQMTSLILVVIFFIFMTLMRKLSVESRGFSPGTLVSSHREC